MLGWHRNCAHREREASPAGALAQEPAVDVAYSLAGVHAAWVSASESGASQTVRLCELACQTLKHSQNDFRNRAFLP